MVKAKCGGLVIDNITITEKNGIITAIETKDSTGVVKPNCGGVEFEATDFKVVNGVLTSAKASDDKIIEETVKLKGCGGLIIDSNYFSYDKKTGLSFENPLNNRTLTFESETPDFTVKLTLNGEEVLPIKTSKSFKTKVGNTYHYVANATSMDELSGDIKIEESTPTELKQSLEFTPTV